MKIRIKLVGYDVVASDYEEFTVKEAIVSSAVEEFYSGRNVGLTKEQFFDSLFLVNGKAAGLESPINDGDALIIMRILGGG